MCVSEGETGSCMVNSTASKNLRGATIMYRKAFNLSEASYLRLILCLLMAWCGGVQHLMFPKFCKVLDILTVAELNGFVGNHVMLISRCIAVRCGVCWRVNVAELGN